MSNVNVLKRLEKVSKLMPGAVVQAEQYSGVSRENATRVDNECCGIVEQAVRIAIEARVAAGDKRARNLLKRVRKALGYTYP
jgi:hypothetical protein